MARRQGERVTYFRREPDWIAVSGFKAAGYFTARLWSLVWHHIEFEYPAALKRRMDPFVPWAQIAGLPIDPINLMIPLEPVFAARLARMHGQPLEKVRRAAEEKALIKRHHPPVNVVGGYCFPSAPDIELSLAEPVKAEDHDFGDLSIPGFLRRPING